MRKTGLYQTSSNILRLVGAAVLLLMLSLMLSVPAFHQHSYQFSDSLSDIAKEVLHDDCAFCDFVFHQHSEVYTNVVVLQLILFTASVIITEQIRQIGNLVTESYTLAGRGPPVIK